MAYYAAFTRQQWQFDSVSGYQILKGIIFLKSCPRCKNEKRLTEFSKSMREKDGLQRECNACRTFRKYKILPEQYTSILLKQDNRCAICQVYLLVGNVAMDHDHNCCPGQVSCGQCIRGILCIRCNVGLGMFKDNVNALLAAARYLESITRYPTDDSLLSLEGSRYLFYSDIGE